MSHEPLFSFSCFPGGCFQRQQWGIAYCIIPMGSCKLYKNLPYDFQFISKVQEMSHSLFLEIIFIPLLALYHLVGGKLDLSHARYSLSFSVGLMIISGLTSVENWGTAGSLV